MNTRIDALEPGGGSRLPPVPLHGVPRSFRITSVDEFALGDVSLLELGISSLDTPIGEWRGPPQFALISVPGICEVKAPIIHAGVREAVLALYGGDGCAKQLSMSKYAAVKIPLGRGARVKEGRLILVAESERHAVWLAPFYDEGHMVLIDPEPGEKLAGMLDKGFSDYVVAGSIEYLRSLGERLAGTGIDPLMIVDAEVRCGLGLCGSCLIPGTGMLACVEGPALRASILMRGGDG